jgi:ABC-2 type transport system permease protein
MKSLFRYFRLYGYFLRFSLSRALEFRFDFFFRIVMDLLFYGVQFAFYKIIFLNTPALAGWSEPQILVFIAGYCLVDALQMTFFSNNIWGLPNLINRGDMDYYVVRPVSSLFFVSLRDFAANSFVNLLFAIGILIWAIARYPEPLNMGKVVLFGFLLINGAFIHYIMNMLLILPVFWTHGGGLQQVFWNLSRVMERPDRIFQGWVWRLFTTLLPFSLMASVPARLLMEEFNTGLFVQLVLVTACMFTVLVLFWRAGLRAYSSASS